MLGSLTTLGDPDNPDVKGNLTAPNGLLVEFGKSVQGFGTIDTPDDPAKPLINNGHIQGFAPDAILRLQGYVKGVGTLDNVVIMGTDAPGFSPASVNRGSVTYSGTLEIEIAGTTPGSGHDQINHILGAGIAYLGGTLDVQLTGGFIPSLGDTFDILTATAVQRTFDFELLPTLTGDLTWIVDYQTSGVSLVVRVPEPGAGIMLMLGMVAILFRRLAVVR